MSKHTPGPWADVSDDPKARHESRRMALVSTSYAGGQAIDCTRSGKSFAEDCANARLVAASPDMLAALIACYSDLQRYAPPNSSGLKLARGAIAKATGEQA